MLIGCAVLLCVGATAAWYVVPWGWLALPLARNPGRFDRARMQRIVEQVRLAGIKPGEERQLRLDDLSDPLSLRAVKPGEQFSRGRGDRNPRIASGNARRAGYS
jgi:hypothetical protein